jgi:phenylacetate-CoA ligase
LSAIEGKLKLLRIGDTLLRRNPFVYPRIRRILSELENADIATRQYFTEARLKTALGWANTTAYGRKVGGGLDVTDWPLLEKDEVRANPAEFHTRSILPVVTATTGGTTGQPMSLVRSVSSIAAEQATIDVAFGRTGLTLASAKVAVLRGDSIKDASDRSPPYWRSANGGRRLIMSSYHLSPRTLPEYINAILSFKPDLLWVYPTTLDALCRLLAVSSSKLHVAVALSSSEMLAPRTWRDAEAILGCRVLDYYGQAERVAFAYATELHAYRFIPGYAHVELIPHSNDAEFSLYEIVGTPLWNRAMPLVRYKSGDLAQLPAGTSPNELHEVALGIRPFHGVMGRSNEILITRDGTRIASANQFPRGVKNLRQLQVIQDTLDSIQVLAITTPQFGAGDELQLLKNIRLKVPDSMRVTISRVQELRRNASGKTPFLMHSQDVKDYIRSLDG